MLLPIHNPRQGKMRVVGFASGSGNTLWKVLELQKELEKSPEGSPFEVVGVFSDNPQSKAIETAEKYGFPHVSLNLRQYHKDRNAPLKDRTVRAMFDAEVLKLIEPFQPDLILLAGYVWATTDAVVDTYRVVNVHPADLSVEKDGHRLYAGAHGIRDALDADADTLHSSSHIATKKLDGGPLLMISPPVPVDKALGLKGDEGERHYLSAVNRQSRAIAARTIWEIARGAFQEDEQGNVYYKNEPAPHGVRLASWDNNIPLYMRPMDAFVKPRSVAVIGASAKGGIGHAIVRNLAAGGFTGQVFAVNRRGENVMDVPGYTTVLDIAEPVDMAVLAVPSSAVIQAASECGEKGVKALVCISAGFKEVGSEGLAREKELLAVVNHYNMRLLGPNCMGIANTDPEVSLFANILQSAPPRGGIGFVTQSGALGAAMVDYAESMGLGFSIIASLGNQADITSNDLLPLLIDDEQTKVVLLYLEAITEPARFCDLIRQAVRKKPVVVIKAGRTAAGAQAASSHTGSLAGNDQVADALLAQAGAIRVKTLSEAFTLAAALSVMPKVKGNRVGVVTNAGGPGILVADMLHDHGFELPLLPVGTREALGQELLPEASTGNPVDLVAPAPPEHYALAVKAMADSGLYDALLLICVPPATIDTGKVAEAVQTELKNIQIPVLSSFFGPTLGSGGRRVMIEGSIPSFGFPEETVITLAQMRDHPVAAAVDAGSKPNKLNPNLRLSIADYERGSYLPNPISRDFLTAYGFEFAHTVMLKPGEEQIERVQSYPVVLKIVHPDITHKTDVGGVVMNIQSQQELEKAVAAMLERFPGSEGVEVQEQIPAGQEVIIGAVRDGSLGHGIMIGFGGTAVEVYQDITFGYAPVSHEQAMEMIRRLCGYPILKGFRGAKGINLEKLADLIARVGWLVMDMPQISEMDLNPLIYDSNKDRFVVVDCRIRL